MGACAGVGIAIWILLVLSVLWSLITGHGGDRSAYAAIIIAIIGFFSYCFLYECIKDNKYLVYIFSICAAACAIMLIIMRNNISLYHAIGYLVCYAAVMFGYTFFEERKILLQKTLLIITIVLSVTVIFI